jgi:ankyrin repeat protein
MAPEFAPEVPVSTLRRFATALSLAWLAAATQAASPAPVDFARDIQPLLELHCYECHGPDKQKNGYRLDRRSSAFSGLVRHNIVPGSSRTSRVYTRVLNGQTGMRMPPNDELSNGEIELLRRWIDEGAVWPDALANESPPPPLDPDAVALVARLRAEARRPESQATLRAALARNPALLNQRGPGGATPLMFVALYGDAALLRAALAAGGDASRHNDASVTALHWAIDDLAKTRLLLDHGAPVDAPSGIGRTPLMLAAEMASSGKVIELLLARGAKPTPAALNVATRANPRGLRLLLAAGLAPTSETMEVALRFNCVECQRLLAPFGLKAPRGLIGTLPIGGPGDPAEVRAALMRGVEVHLKDLKGRAPLLLAAGSEKITTDLLQQLVDRGADVHARGPDGRNALDHALRVGREPIVEFFTRAGLRPTPRESGAARFVSGNSPGAAVQRALPLLQRSSARFYEGGGCVSCHHNLMTASTIARARQRGFAVDEDLVRQASAILARDIEAKREQTLQGVFAPGGQATTTGYLLMALEADGQPASLATDALVRLLRNSQHADGNWLTTVRPPQEGSEFTSTAVSLRGIRLYGDRFDAANRHAVNRARGWLERNVPFNTEDQVFQLFGLVWSDSAAARRRAAVERLLRLQRADGGWAQLPWGSSDAYATGQALVALNAAGVAPDSERWKRGARFLVDTQLADGSWWVRSRSHASQSYFESGFPHGEDQFISAAATNWATQALAIAAGRPDDSRTASSSPRAGAASGLPSTCGYAGRPRCA